MSSDFKKFLNKFFSEMRQYMDYTEASDIKKIQKEISRKIPLGRSNPRESIFPQGIATSEEYDTDLYHVAVATAQGPRDQMEDEHLISEITVSKSPFEIKKFPIFAVFDGHGGVGCARYVKAELPKILAAELEKCLSFDDLEIYNTLCRTFVIIDKNFKNLLSQKTFQKDISGTTATMCLMIGTTVWIANVGDSRTVLVRNNRAQQLSEEAKASVKKYEREIYLRGGDTRHGRVIRPTSSLDMARSIGEIEQPSVSAFPTIRKLDFENIKNENFHIILACDGLWDVVSPQIAAKVCTNSKTLLEASQKLKSLAFTKGTTDNVTVMVVATNKPFPF